MSAQNPPQIQPYWECLNDFFLFPLSAAERLQTLIYTAVMLFAMFAIMLGPIYGLIAIILATAATVRHAFTVLDRTSQGYLGDAFNYDSQVSPYLPYKHVGALIIAGLLAEVIANKVGTTPSVLFLLLAMLAWPASVMVLTLSNSLIESINPSRLFDTMRDIGLPYLGLWACLALLSGGHSFLNALMVQTRFSTAIKLAVLAFLGVYFILVMFRLMGYVLYQYHVEMGLAVINDEAPENQPSKPEDALLEKCAELVAAGDSRTALDLLHEGVTAYPSDVRLHERRLKLLASRPGPEILEQHDKAAQQLLQLYARKSQHGAMLVLLQQVRQRDPSFLPADAQITLSLARQAFNARQADLVLALLKGFDQRFPRNAALPDVMLLGARLLCEQLRQDQQAQRILHKLIQAFPQHPASQEAQQLLQVISKLQTQN